MDDTILQQLDRYRDLLDRKEQLAEATKENNQAIETAREALVDVMLNEEIPQISRSGYSYTLTPKAKYSKAAGQDKALMETLRSFGLGDLIQQTVNPKSLQGALSDLAEENDGQLPEEFEGIVNVYEFTDITRRKCRAKK